MSPQKLVEPNEEDLKRLLDAFSLEADLDYYNYIATIKFFYPSTRIGFTSNSRYSYVMTAWKDKVSFSEVIAGSYSGRQSGSFAINEKLVIKRVEEE